MNINFIASSIDSASVNIAQKVVERFGLEETDRTFCEKPTFERGRFKLLYINLESICLDQIILPFESDLVVMLSKHKSEKTINSLTTHPTGNLLNKAKLGGYPKHIAYTNPWYMSEYYRNLIRIYEEPKKDNVTLSMEVTHHGPTEKKIPLFFVEIGSEEKQWKNQSLAEKIAEALFQTMNQEPKKHDAFVGFGGGHYAPAFSHYLLKEEVAIGHMVPKYALIENPDENVLLTLFTRSLLDKPRALVDRKGIPIKQYNNLITFFDKHSIEFLKI